ncbi:MAG: hypothetical protein UU88_C0011G0001 [Parcubacteria group bacterium GW2011_GWC1_42_11]|uniref:LysM domain-containing protein n=1 Tax=Candidatus Nomurabacteria bacterium GW2011_GWC2_42_20 TaxID=1618756 RepID=A0A0G0ZH58_9BACT|nr:MAG: hypothetical protein UU88_C0011G0001 [Parcubacteria group bacterium GW2011_GWC1_42_11]KKS48042.1 MAG: hypothetical protein UV12_C0003G0001 [Candidatus Nomurabacteria bacterium GW2011_GWC2_42_20]TAN35500.1 MAG: LysM domain-containing protein [Patescibacteria group bacterium]HBH71372.1 hypothetical protein [Candidatus Yonathbacteria bacterium]
MCKIIVMLFSFSLLFGFQNVAVAEPLPVSTSDYCIVTHVVRNGETLTKIAQNFGVPIESILSSRFNSALARRNNPNLIFVDEKIAIPLPATTAVKSVPIAPKVATSSTETTPAVSPTETFLKEGMPYVKIAFLLAVFTSVELFLFGVYFLVRDWRNKNTSEGKAANQVYGPEKAVSCMQGVTSAEGIIETLGEARVKDLVLAMHMPIVIDEKGNQVLLCNISRFMQNEKLKMFQGGLVKDLSRNIKTLGEA